MMDDRVDRSHERIWAIDVQAPEEDQSVTPSSDDDPKGDARSWFDRLERGARVAAALAVAVSALVAATQYWESGRSERRERSVAQLEAWQASDLRERYARLAGVIETVLARSTPLDPETDGEMLALAMSGIGRVAIDELAAREITYDGDWRADVDALVEFYSGLEFCLASNLCDVSILHDYFADGAGSFWAYYHGYADNRRAAHYPRYGESVDALIDRFEEMQ